MSWNKLSIFFSLAILLAVLFLPQRAIAFVKSDSRVEMDTSLAISSGTPINLSTSASGGSLPSIVKTAQGAVMVAWQQNFTVGKKIQQEILARFASDGINFDPAVNVSNTLTNSREPFLFNTNDGNVHVLYEDYPGNAIGFQIMDSFWNGSAWSAPTRLTSQAGWTYQDPNAVQATDGKIWFVTHTFFGKRTATDALAQQIGGSVFNLSHDGSAVRRPAIAAGENGQIYVAWVDHANEGGKVTPGIKVWQWNGSAWLRILPDPTTEVTAAFPWLAYRNGNLYLSWRSGTSTLTVKERVWNGSTWGPLVTVSNGPAAMYPKIAVPASGNIFVTWSSNGVVYLKKNNDAAVPVSNGVTGAANPALFVDENDVAYIAFQKGKNGGSIWYVTAQ